MPGFDPTKLRPEEESGDFDAFDNESFLLEQLPAYPGNENPPAPEPLEVSPLQFLEPEPFHEVMGTAPPEPMHELPAIEEVQIPTPIPEPIAPIISEPIDMPKPVVAPPQPPPAIQDLMIDDDLLALLRDDLEESEKRRRARNQPEAAPKPLPRPALPLEFNDDDAFKFDLSTIEAKHPTSYSDPIVPTTPPPQKPSDTSLPPIEPPDTAPEPEKKERKPSAIPWKMVGIVVLIASLLGGGGAFFMFNKSQNKQMSGADSLKNHLIVQKEEKKSENENEKKESVPTEEKPKLDSVKTSEQPKHEEVIPEIKKEESKPEIKEEQKKEPVKVEKKPETIKKQEKSKEIKSEPTKPIAKSEIKPIPKIATDSRKAPSTPPTNVKGVFVVQIYSTPLLEDAEEWLKKIKKKNAVNAFISSQNIRGQQWHRIRFGTFSTQAEAEESARTMGFANSWVVRVR